MKKFLTVLLIVAGLISATIVGAAVQIFDGTGEWHTNDDDNQQIAMARAQQRAQTDAQKKAGVYLQTFSRAVNLELAADEITAVTNNIIEIVGEVHFDKKIIPLSDRQTTILYTATLKAKIDPDGIFDWLKRDDRQKVTIVRQNDSLQDAIQKNDELAASLTEQYNQAASQAERDRIREQMNDADRDFLANEKLQAGNKLYYARNYSGAINFYGEALQLKPNYFEAYNNRGCAYDELKNYAAAIRDYDEALKLKQHEFMYNNRGLAYAHLENYAAAVQDYGKAIELNPNYAEAYNNRGIAYGRLDEYEAAVQDFNKAIQFNPNRAELYSNRGIAYILLGNLNQAIVDATKAIELDPNYANAYQVRGLCWQALGDAAKAQADFAKAKEFGFNG